MNHQSDFRLVSESCSSFFEQELLKVFNGKILSKKEVNSLPKITKLIGVKNETKEN